MTSCAEDYDSVNAVLNNLQQFESYFSVPELAIELALRAYGGTSYWSGFVTSSIALASAERENVIVVKPDDLHMRMSAYVKVCFSASISLVSH